MNEARVIDHGDGSVTIDLSGGFKLERGERAAFDQAYKWRKDRTVHNKGLCFWFYFQDRRDGMSRGEALAKHIPGGFVT